METTLEKEYREKPLFLFLLENRSLTAEEIKLCEKRLPCTQQTATQGWWQENKNGSSEKSPK